MSSMRGRSWADVDLSAIEANVGVLRAAAPAAELWAVVKADGYGHGAEPVARAALAAGATRLAVAQVAEGEALRAAGLDVGIIVLSEPDPGEMERARRAGLDVTLYSPAGIEAASTVGGVIAHLKLDTGMSRVGAAPGDAVARARAITGAGLRLGSVWTHLACADADAEQTTARSTTECQLDAYEAALDDLAASGIDPGLRHAANSAGTIGHPRSHFDAVRCGIALYGLPPSPGLAGRVPLRPALAWRTRVGYVKRVEAGAGVSYGHRFRAERPTTVATIPVGYADGYRRGLWDRGGAVLIGGVRRPILGVVTMDQTIVDCGDDDIDPGDEAVLIGSQGDAEITADDLAAALDTINYEIPCGIGRRVERRYHRG